VAALAGLAGAISYSHMRQLAAGHGQAGWHGHAFPLSVDGLELVALLVLLDDRRRGRRSGWLPWAALITGTTGSLAANVATAHPDLISRVIAGWPALALLIAVKLLSGMLTHPGRPDNLAAPVPDPARPRPEAQDASGDPHLSRSTSRVPSSPADRSGSRSRSPRQAGTAVRKPGFTRPPAMPDSEVAVLWPAVRAVMEELDRDGLALTRDALAAGLRERGCRIRNSRVTPLLQALRDGPAKREIAT
jgi:hypothetical protein